MSLGLYLHIPYCFSKCRYCDFYSAPGQRGVPPEYPDALLRELYRFAPDAPLRPDTIYFGGGTPSLLTPGDVARLLEAAQPRPGAEITLEANPETVTEETLRGFRAAGVNRISFGVQSARDSQLKTLGRPHTAKQARAAFAAAQRAGFTNISGDIMLALPHYTQAEFDETLELIENGGAREDDDDFQSPLDMLFEALEEEEPDHVAVREYKIFKQAAGKTAKSILLSAAVRLSAFILPQITRITSRDDMELGLMGERKQAVFAIIPDNDGTFNYLVGMLYTCAFQALYYQADKVHQGALPVPVRLMMDEFCNVSLPDDFGKLQATMRSRNIMSTIVLQNISALKALFKDDWEGLLGNADTLVYLGGNEPSTHKYISELLGKETLDTRNRSVSRGSHGSSSVSYQQTGRELMTPDEVRTLDNDYALLFIRGERPVMDKKYDILKHPYIKLTEDGGAAPYVHHPGLTYAQADLSVPFESLDYIEILE